MIVISDSNIIFSCFYTPNGVIASILKNKKNKLQFIAPSFLLEEVKEHLPEIMKDNLLTKRKATDILTECTQNITFYELKDINKQNREKASKIAKNIDPDDYLFIALHFEKGHKIWTCDNILSKRLKEMGYDICISTQELKTNIYKKVSPLPKDSQNKK